jgi:hypothetical protein
MRSWKNLRFLRWFFNVKTPPPPPTVGQMEWWGADTQIELMQTKLIVGSVVKPKDDFSAGALNGAFPGVNVTPNTEFEVILIGHKVTTQTGTQSGIVVFPLDASGNAKVSYPYVWDPELFVDRTFVAQAAPLAVAAPAAS